jgi:hypothetical protein
MFAKTRTSFLTRSSRVNETKIWGFRFRIESGKGCREKQIAHSYSEFQKKSMFSPATLSGFKPKLKTPKKGGVLVSLARELRVKIVPPNRVLVTICALILGMYGNTGTENNPHRFQRTITVSFKL